MNDVSLVAQQHNERVRVLSQQLHAIECRLDHIVVEIVDDVLGHVENGEPDEEWLHHLAHRCVQLDTDQILGVHGSCDHVMSMLLDDGLAFIPCVSELHFHSIQPSLHEFAMG